MVDRTEYFNFPIVMLDDFMQDRRKCLSDIVDYTIYKYMHDEIEDFQDNPIESILQAARDMLVTLGNEEQTYLNGETIFNSLNDNLPLVGIRRNVYWDYHDNEKTEFEKIVLLAYLALRSILGNKEYVNVKNDFWFSRMAGSVKKLESMDMLPPRIAKFHTEHYRRKIKTILQLDWGMTHYAHYTKGFNVSWKKDFKWLKYKVESNKLAARAKELKNQQKRESKEVMEMIRKKLEQ